MNQNDKQLKEWRKEAILKQKKILAHAYKKDSYQPQNEAGESLLKIFLAVIFMTFNLVCFFQPAVPEAIQDWLQDFAQNSPYRFRNIPPWNM